MLPVVTKIQTRNVEIFKMHSYVNSELLEQVESMKYSVCIEDKTFENQKRGVQLQ